LIQIALLAVLAGGIAAADDVSCDMSGYKEGPGLKASAVAGKLELAWEGERQEELRASFGIQNAQPVVLELAARKKGGQWTVLGRNLSPEFHVNAGRRRISNQQLNCGKSSPRTPNLR
jgi:hypothetical protein